MARCRPARLTLRRTLRMDRRANRKERTFTLIRYLKSAIFVVKGKAFSYLSLGDPVLLSVEPNEETCQ